MEQKFEQRAGDLLGEIDRLSLVAASLILLQHSSEKRISFVMKPLGDRPVVFKNVDPRERMIDIAKMYCKFTGREVPGPEPGTYDFVPNGSPDMQKWICNNKELFLKADTVGSSGIEDGGSMHMVLRLGGPTRATDHDEWDTAEDSYRIGGLEHRVRLLKAAIARLAPLSRPGVVNWDRIEPPELAFWQPPSPPPSPEPVRRSREEDAAPQKSEASHRAGQEAVRRSSRLAKKRSADQSSSEKKARLS